MSKSGFELLTLIEAYQKYNKLANYLQQEEHKKYFQTATEITLKLIEQFCKQKNIIIEDFQKFYEEAVQYLNTQKSFAPSLQKVLNFTGEGAHILNYLQKEDLMFWGELSGFKPEYWQTTSKSLFCKIMGQKALKEKQEMEENLNINILSIITQKKGYDFETKYCDWVDILNSRKQEGNLTEEQYTNYLRNIEYISNYYKFLHNRQNRMLTLILKLGNRDI